MTQAEPKTRPGPRPGADLDLLDPLISVRHRATPGGGNPQSVATQIAHLRAELSPENS